jgi:protein ImuB
MPVSGPERLWLCLYLPQLPLEASGGDPGTHRAVAARAGRTSVILLCDEAARQHGVQPGMPVNAALALVPELAIRARKPEREREALRALATWALRFTPAVSIDPGGALLLEIGGSLASLGDPGKLRAAVVAGAVRRGHAVLAALAPTARAALWLACAGEQQPVTECARLPTVLARLPVQVPGWPDEVRRTLRRMGITRLGECMRLPRDGLSRRIGPSCLAEIDEALGKRPEVWQPFRQNESFASELELPAETRDGSLLMEALQILLGRLQRQLRASQAGVRSLWVRLGHRAVPATMLRLGLAGPSADVVRIGALAAVRVAELRVKAPVVSIRLDAEVEPMGPAASASLLALAGGQGERVAGLVERLRARLGPAAVYGVRPSGEHRPEHAWQVVPDLDERADAGEGVPAEAPRPLWLLDPPQPLQECGERPSFRGALVFRSGPERIETGWWDGHDVQRDYHVALGRDGMRLWIFRDRRDGGWYLHGLFG